MSCYLRQLSKDDFGTRSPAGISEYVKFYETHKQDIENLFTPQHPMRAWEYGFALKYLDQHRPKTVIDIGCAGSPLPYLCGKLTENFPLERNVGLDFLNYGVQLKMQSELIEFIKSGFIEYDFGDQKFDAVNCISVIEHVVDDAEFFNKLVSIVNPGGYLFLTTDYHDSGKPLHIDHLRAYDEHTLISLIPYLKRERMINMIDGTASKKNIKYQGTEYNFASIFLQV